MRLTSWLAIISAIAVFSILITPVAAGPLNGHAGAYFDGTITWTGTTAYNSGGGLSGTVDWTVFPPGTFPYAGLGGWSPNPGEFVYSYQVENNGTLPLTKLSVVVINPASNVGAADLLTGGVLPSSMSITVPGDAVWNFTPPSDVPSGGGISTGLVFSSDRVPMYLFGATVDGGQSTFVIPLPSPDTPLIPEPASLALLGLGLLTLVPFARRRRR